MPKPTPSTGYPTLAEELAQLGPTKSKKIHSGIISVRGTNPGNTEFLAVSRIRPREEGIFLTLAGATHWLSLVEGIYESRRARYVAPLEGDTNLHGANY